MVTLTPLPPFISVSNEIGTFPRPVSYGDDGKTALTLKIISAAAEDLTALELSPLVLPAPDYEAITVPVALTAGDPQQSVIDIAAAVNAGYLANTVDNMVMVSRDVLYRGSGTLPPNFDNVTFSGAATTYVVANTRYLIQNNGGDRVFLMDASQPRTQPIPGPDADAGECSTGDPFAIGPNSWLWLPDTETAHRIVSLLRIQRSDSFYSQALYPDAWHMTLDPAPVLNAAPELYAAIPIPPISARVGVRNVGGAPAIVDGSIMAPDGNWLTYQRKGNPIQYDCSGTTLEFMFDFNNVN